MQERPRTCSAHREESHQPSHVLRLKSSLCDFWFQEDTMRHKGYGHPCHHMRSNMVGQLHWTMSREGRSSSEAHGPTVTNEQMLVQGQDPGEQSAKVVGQDIKELAQVQTWIWCCLIMIASQGEAQPEIVISVYMPPSWAYGANEHSIRRSRSRQSPCRALLQRMT